MDWLRLRKELQELRVEARIETPAELARRMEVEKSTIYRIEDIEGNADLKPDLETIELWLQHTTGISLTMFFARIGGLISAVKADKDLASPPEPSHEPSPIPALTLTDLIALITDISATVLTRLGHAGNRAAVSGARADQQTRDDDRTRMDQEISRP